jgi:transposase
MKKQIEVEKAPSTEATSARESSVPPPDPEVSSDRAKRRTYTAEYKKRILEEADACSKPGEIGAMLRREGLYSTLLYHWRSQREAATNAALSPKVRGRKKAINDAMAERVAELEREKQRLEDRLRKAEIIIDVQKKVSQLLGIPLASQEKGGSV